MEGDFYYVMVPYEDAGHPLTRYLFGPYTNYDQALEKSDEVGGWEILTLPTDNLEEAVGILSKEMEK